MSKTYSPGKINPIIKIIAGVIRRDKTILNDMDRLLATVYINIPELKDHTQCANCGASMAQYEYNIDVLDIALVIGMGKQIRRGMNEGKNFTEANQIHVPTLDVSDAVRHRTTKCSKLGLVAKHKIDGKQVGGTWVVTNRGFNALKGDEIPTGTIVWRGQILDRPNTVTTFNTVRNTYSKRMQTYERRHRKAPKVDHRDAMGNYYPNDWVDFAGYHEANLF